MSTLNIQDRNVGNRGDAHKHAALVALARLLRAAEPGLIRHVETHCYRLDAPLPEGTGWPWNLTWAAASYLALEAGWVDRGRYRCSAGLAADALGPPLSLRLAEADEATREALATAVREEGLPVEALVSDALLLAQDLSGPPGGLFIHVDPFDHPGRYWPVVKALLTGLRRADQPAVVLAFGYDRHQALVWPDPPADLIALGRLDARPYGLAAWGSVGLANRATAALAALGWTR